MAGDSRESILARLWAASPAERPRPARLPRPAAPARPIEVLREALESAGGELHLVEARRSEDLLAAVPGLESAEHVWSAIPEVRSAGVGRAAQEQTGGAAGRMLDGDGQGTAGQEMKPLEVLDFTVLPGALAIAESGAVWNVPQSPLERAAALLAEHLVLVVERRAVVGNLHDAYGRIDPAAAPFGWFLSGPSKTADIEQSLVFGAHGPRRLSLVLA